MASEEDVAAKPLPPEEEELPPLESVESLPEIPEHKPSPPTVEDVTRPAPPPALVFDVNDYLQ